MSSLGRWEVEQDRDPVYGAGPAIDEPLRRVLGRSQVVLFTQDRDLRYTWVFDPRHDDINGTAVGKRDTDIFQPDDAAALTAIKQGVIDSGKPARETIPLAYHGETRFYDLVVEPLPDQAGVVCAAMDLTEHKRVEDEYLFQSTVLESIHDSVIVTDRNGRITFWNRGAEDIFGYPADDMLGETVEVLYPEGTLDDVEMDLASIEAGNDYQGEWCGRRRDGSPVWLDIRTTALRDASGELIGFVGVGKDVTERKQAEDAQAQALRRERASRRRLRQFLALVAHDLRNPLATAYGYAQLLQRRRLALDSRAYGLAVDALMASSELMQRLVSDLADAAAAGEGHFAIRPAPMELVALVEEVVAHYSDRAERHHLTISAPAAVPGKWDELRLRQLLTNLVDNAIKYSPEGGAVTVTVQELDNDVVIAVEDNGVGIAPEEQEHLFDLFSRGEETDDIAGFGLGLYICRAIVEAHGGRLEVESALGQGSTFRVILPRVSSIHDASE